MSIDTATAAGKTNFARVPQGVPAGGQFSATIHAEAEVSLSQDDCLSGETILKQAQSSARYWQDRMGQKNKSNTVDMDDIAQETALATLMAIRDQKDVKNYKGMIHNVARNIASRGTQTVWRAEDRVAYRMFEAKCQEIINREQRVPTVAEEKAIEKEIFDTWHDPRHKPSRGFRIASTVERSLDANMFDDDSATLGSTLVSTPQHEAIPVNSYMDRAFDALDEKGVASKALARRLAWNAVAEAAEVPLALEGSLSQRHATRYRGIMLKHEDQVSGACRDWDRGIDNEATEALFAPFGNLTPDQEEKVVVMLERLGGTKAQSMWESAVSFANNKHSEIK